MKPSLTTELSAAAGAMMLVLYAAVAEESCGAAWTCLTTARRHRCASHGSAVALRRAAAAARRHHIADAAALRIHLVGLPNTTECGAISAVMLVGRQATFKLLTNRPQITQVLCWHSWSCSIIRTGD